MDQIEFNAWVAETQKSVIRFCRQFVGDWAEAEDMAQEAYLRAWEKRGGFRGESSRLTWQLAIARRVCLDRLRAQKRGERTPLDERQAAPAPDVETALDVQRALLRLGPDDRTILYLRVQEELSFEEIGEILRRTPAACRKRYERAKERFKAIYNGKGESCSVKLKRSQNVLSKSG